MYWWLAEYDDGTIVKKHNDDGSIVSADSINRDKVRIFILMNGKDCVLKLFLDERRKLVYRRRVEKAIGGEEKVCHIVGWRMKVKSEIVQSMSYVFEDSFIEMAGDFDENHPWFYSPNLRDFELPCL